MRTTIDIGIIFLWNSGRFRGVPSNLKCRLLKWDPPPPQHLQQVIKIAYFNNLLQMLVPDGPWRPW